MADAPPGVRFTFLDYVGLGFILIAAEQILRRPKDGWPIWIPGFVLGLAALLARDRSPQLVTWFLAWFRAPKKLALVLKENAELKNRVTELTEAVATRTVSQNSKLVILRAVYGAGAGTDVDVTNSLQQSPRDGLVIPVDNSLVSGHDPAYGVRKRLVVDYSYGDGTVHSAGALESTPGMPVRLILPEDLQIRQIASELAGMKADIQQKDIELVRCRQIRDQAISEARAAKDRVAEIEATKSKTSQSPIPLLRLKVLGMVSELQSFLSSQGEEPKTPAKNPAEADEEYLARVRVASEPILKWRAKFLGDYRLQFKNNVANLQDELRSRARVDDHALNTAINMAENERIHGVTAVQAVIKRLWELALKIHV